MTRPDMLHNTHRAAHCPGNLSGWRPGLLACAVILGLTSCAEAPKKRVEEKKAATVLVYPLPPDDPRFYFERTIYSSGDVVAEEKKEESLQDLLTGKSSGSSQDRFRKPYAVVVHKGRIFVSEPRSKVIRVFDVPEGRYFTIGDKDPGGLSQPLGIDVDRAGNLYVADAKAKAIMVYDRDGKFLRTLATAKTGEPELFKRMASVTVDKNGDRIYVVDVGGSPQGRQEYHRVRVFDARSGEHLFDIGKRGTGSGEFNLPKDVAIGKNKQIYVVDSANFRIQVFDEQGKYVKDFGKLGSKLGSFGRPKEIATDADGNVYVIDAVFANFQIFNADGELLMFIGKGAYPEGPARYEMPSGIYVDEDGRIYVVDQLYKKLDIFRPAALGADDGYLGKRLPRGEKSANIGLAGGASGESVSVQKSQGADSSNDGLPVGKPLSAEEPGENAPVDPADENNPEGDEP